MTSPEDKLTYIVENIGSINATLQFQARQLEEHMRRTDLLEKRLAPIEDHVKFVQSLLKLLMYSASIGGSLLAFLKVLGKM